LAFWSPDCAAAWSFSASDWTDFATSWNSAWSCPYAWSMLEVSMCGLSSLPYRRTFLCERPRALAGVLGTLHRRDDLALSSEDLRLGPVDRFGQDALGRRQRQRAVGSDCLGQLERSLERLPGLGEAAHKPALMRPLRIAR